MGTKVERTRQKEIDSQNQKLLGKIMDIMKRKNQSVSNARALPTRLIGGNSTLLSSRAIKEGMYR